MELGKEEKSSIHSVEARGMGGNFRTKMWESEVHQSQGMQVEGFRGLVATDGSLLGKLERG